MYADVEGGIYAPIHDFILAHAHTRARLHKHTHTHRKTQEAMLSRNVINAVKRLTSGYLFKSRHQTHSFFSFYLHRSQKLLSGEKRRFSERRRGQRARPRTRPNSLSLSLSLARSLSSFTDGACRASAALLPGQGRSLSDAQWTVGARRWRWTHRDKMMSAALESRHCLAPSGPGQRVESEGKEGGGQGATGSNGDTSVRVCLCLSVK